MTETTQPTPGNKISRRIFGQLLGLPALLATSAATVTLSGCGGNDDPAPLPDAAAAKLSKAAFVTTISTHFDWVHSSEYHDPYKRVQPTFIDVTLGATAHAKEIETALEESIISNVLGYFYPDQPMTREEAAEIYVKAFKIAAATTDALSAFTDAASITASRRASVNALVAAGYMKGVSATLLAPADAITAGDAKAVLDSIDSARSRHRK